MWLSVWLWGCVVVICGIGIFGLGELGEVGFVFEKIGLLCGFFGLFVGFFVFDFLVKNVKFMFDFDLEK